MIQIKRVIDVHIEVYMTFYCMRCRFFILPELPLISKREPHAGGLIQYDLIRIKKVQIGSKYLNYSSVKSNTA